MLEEIKGRVWKLGNNIDTDLIYPGRCLPILDPLEMAKHVLEGYDKDFPNKIQKGDIIVAGSNFGCGSSREQAATSLKYAGVSCVIAKSFSRIFFRNAINQGLALVQSGDAYDLVKEGEEITIDFVKGEIMIQDKKIPFPPLPDVVMGILQDGGLIPHLKKTLKK
ncbi:MAG: 3-isopropylmalate dehydratase small subunit [candidate division Zixibacteria bacterium]|nr:3-isopropylmalate dehydratase small subunit [candidate division Zixibacteria bacterium]